MHQVRQDGLSRRDKLRALLRGERRPEKNPRMINAAIWRTLIRGLNPLRVLGSQQKCDDTDIELFVTRLEERRVLNGDMGMLAGVMEIAEMQVDTELYDSELLGSESLSMMSGYSGSHYCGDGAFGTQAHDLSVVLNDVGSSDVSAAHSSDRSSDNGMTASEPFDSFPVLQLRSGFEFQARGEGVNAAPVFSADTFAFSVAENSDVGTVVGVATATDADSPILAYSITGGNTESAFAIDAVTGAISVANKSAIDFETTPNFALNVQVTDNHAMMPMTDVAVVNVNLTDVQTSLSISNASDAENAGVLVFDLTATGDAINQSFDVTYETVDATATDALSGLGTNDYNGAASGIVSFDGDATNEVKTLSIAVNDDSTVERDETFLVNLLSVDSNDVAISVVSGSGTITNDDTTIVSISDVVKAEGDSGTTDFVFTISSSAPVDGAITLNANTIDATATAGTDYTAVSNQLITIAAGANSATLTVQVTGETDVEVTETFSVELSDPTFRGSSDPARVIIGNTGTGAILDDDLANRATLSINDVTMSEGDSGTTNFVFTIQSDIIAQEDIAVTINTSDTFGATAGADYTAITNQTAMISKGSDSTSVTVEVMTESIVELDEAFTLTLSNPLFNGTANASRVILGDEAGIGTIVNDDAAAISITDVSVVEGDSGVSNLVFVVATDALGSRDMDVRVNTADLVDAVGDIDYAQLTAQTAVIAAGTMQTSVTVAVLGDDVVETNETLSVLLSSARFNGTTDPSRVTIADDTGIGTIIDDDTTTISINDVTQTEGDGGFTSFVFTLDSTAFTGQDIDVTVNTASLVEAVAGTDYTAITAGTATIAAGTNSGTLVVDVAGDLEVELQESFSVSISEAKFNGVLDPARITITDATGIGTIIDDDAAAISVDDVAINETDSGTTDFVFTIRSDVEASRDLEVTVNTADLIATVAGADYTAITNQTATISMGTLSTTISVSVAGDQLVELDETFSVNLSDAKFDGVVDATRVSIADASAVGTILNDDVAALSINDVSIVEGNGGTTDFVFDITSNRLASENIGVTVDTASLFEAIAGTDYTELVAQTATIMAGSTSTTVTVVGMTDAIVELDETFSVTLSDGKFAATTDTNRITFADAVGVGTLTNDDSASFSIDDVSLIEGDAGLTNFSFTVSTDLVASKDLEVTVNTANLSGAVAGADYMSITNQPVTIAQGNTSATVTVSVMGDALVEADETFTVNLTDAKFNGVVDATRAGIATGTGTGTILNDDVASLRISDVSMTELNAGASTVYQFAITSDSFASEDIAVAVDTAGILGAIGGTDYTEIVAGSAVISAGSDSTIVSVTVIGDALVELDELFEVRLSEGRFDNAIDTSRVTFADSVGVGTIVNDDSTTLSIANVTMAEGDSGTTTFSFTVSSTAFASEDLTFKVNTSDLLDAVAGIDYVAITDQLETIAAGSDTTTVTVSVLAEERVEIDETFMVDLSDAGFDGTFDASRVTITNATAIGTITNDDTAQLSIDDISINEGDSGLTAFTFTITASSDASRVIDFQIDTASAFEAVAGVDYTAISGQASSIGVGATSTMVTVNVIGDDLVELDETFSVVLSNVRFNGAVDASRAVLLDATGLGTIVNDEVISLSIDDVSMDEVDAGATTTYDFTITSDAMASEDIEITVNTADLLDAIGGTDYTSQSNATATIAAGATSTTVSVIVAGDDFVELDETFEVRLSDAKFDSVIDTNRIGFSDAIGLGTIINDDTTTISIDDVSVTEGDSGNVDLVFTVTSDVIVGRNVDVRIDTADLLESEAGTDYIAIANQDVTINAGSSSATFAVSVIGDTILEVNETLTANLTNVRFNGVADAGRVTIADATGVGTIVNDDGLTVSINDVSQVEGDSGTSVFAFTISSTATASKDILVTVETSDLVEAMAGTDYTPIAPQTATISAGDTSTILNVVVAGDELVEIDETFAVNLSNATVDGNAVTIADAQGIGTILNDDIAGLKIDDVSMVESNTGFTTYTFNITSDSLASKDIQFSIDTADLIDAVSGLDYTAVSTTGVIAEGAMATTVSVNVVGDLIVETDETFAVNLSNAVFNGVVSASQVAFDDSQGVGTILNNDATSVSIDDVSLNEGNVGVTSFEFTVSLDAVADKDVQVTVNTATLAEAMGGTDFVAIAGGTATIKAGMSAATLTVDVIGDNDVEIDETFNVNLTNAVFDGAGDASRVTIADATGVGTILNDDTATVSINDVTIVEGDSGTTDFVFTISSSAVASRNIDVTVDTADLVEAVAGTDYTAITAQNVTIAAGDIDTTIAVAVTGDQIVEVDETFEVNLSNVRLDGVAAPALVTIADGTGVGTIENNDTTSLTIGDVTLAEGNGTTSFVFTINSSLISSKNIALTVSTADLFEAEAGTDYVALVNAPVVISANTSSTTITVDVTGETHVEVDETFSVNLNSALFDTAVDTSRVQIADATAIGTITNDDIAELSINDVSLVEGANGAVTAYTFTVSSSATASKEISLNVATSDLVEATAGVDYTAVSQAIKIAAGATSTTVTVNVADDAIVELDETFQVNLSTAAFDGTVDTTRATISNAVGIGTILNDDLASITIDDVTMTEGGVGTTTAFTFTITTDSFASKDLAVQVDTAMLLDALGGTDFTAISAQDVVIASGNLSNTITVNVAGENVVELDETFEVKLTNARFDAVANPSRVAISDDSGLGTIVNDDSTTLSINDVTMQEGSGGGLTAFVFTITSDVAAGRDIAVAVDTTDMVEALGGTDYNALVSHNAVLKAGDTSTTVTVDVNADSIVEIDEAFAIAISNERFDGTTDVASRVTISDGAGVGTIVNDDAAALSINDVTMIEGDNGASNFVFTVSSTAAASRNIDFTVNTADLLEASSGVDYAQIQNQINRIAIGDTETQVVVTVIGDTDVELDETFSVNLSNALLDGAANPTLLTISDNTGVGTMLNDDIASFSITDVRAAEGDTATSGFVFTVSTNATASRDMQVRVDTTDGLDTIAGVDYDAVSNLDVTIAAGTTSTNVTVNVIGDTVLEINETFNVNLTNARFDGNTDATRAAIADAVGVGVIENDDGLTVAINDVTMIEGDAGATSSFVFTISSTDTASRDINVTVNTADLVGAVAGVDYTAISSQTAVIRAGDTSTTVTVGVTGDGLVELDETFSVDISNAQIDGTIVTIADARGVGTILNDEIASLSVNDVSINEGDMGLIALQFTVTSDRMASEAIGFTVNTASLLDATPSIDYAEVVNRNFAIAAGQTTTTFDVTIVGDDLVELDESFSAILSAALFDGNVAPSRVIISDAVGVGTITNDDSVTLRIDDVTHSESDSGLTNYVFTVTSDGLASKDLGITVDIPDRMDAVGAPDLNALVAQTATIAAGDTSTTITVAVRGDLVVENDETFSVNLSEAAFDGVVDTSRVTFADDTGTGTIINDDSLTISIDDVTQSESNTSFVFTVRSDAIASENVQVTVNTADFVEALGGDDYTTIAATPAIIAAGTDSTSVTVTVNNDSIVEVDESFKVNLTAALFGGATDAGRVSIADASATGTILNDDTATLSINDVTLAEGNVGNTAFTFTITSDLVSSRHLGVTVDTNNLLDALGGTDYLSVVADPAVITAGDRFTTVTVNVLGDEIVEIDETFTLDLSNAVFDGSTDATRVNIGDSSGLGTILNDDVAALSINDVSLDEGDSGLTAFTFTISSSHEASRDIGVNVDTSSLSEALPGTDYSSLVAQQAVIAVGSFSTTVTVNVLADEIVEIDETFATDLSAALFDGNTDSTRVTIVDSRGVGTIQNDDIISLSIDDLTKAEGDSGVSTFTFTISADKLASKDIGVAVNTADLLDAVGGTDYASISQAAVIRAGFDSTTVTVDVIGDEIVEIDETFAVNLSASLFNGSADATRVTIGDSVGVGKILNDDTATLSINDVTMSEGDSGTTAFSFTISSNLIASKDIGLTVNTNSLLDAVGGADYTSLVAAPAVISAGDNSTTVIVSVLGDQIVELDETFTVDLSLAEFNGASDATRVTITDARGLGTITNDDVTAISIDDVSIAEGDTGVTSLTFTISSDLQSSKDLGVTVNTNDLLEAIGGTDYTSIVAQPAVISAGTNSTTVTVDILGDEIVELDETFTVDLTAALFDGVSDSTRVGITDAQGIGTIINDDTATLSIDDLSIAEGDAGTTAFTFTISTDLLSSKNLDVTVNTNDLLEAIGGTDYTSIANGTATILAGTNSTQVTVDVIGDQTVEVDETFTLNLSASQFDGATDATRIVIGDASGLGTIINDDTASLTIDDVSIAEGDTGVTSFTFTISSDLTSSKDLSVTVDTNDLLEANGGTDYTSIVAQSAVISAGDLSTTVTVDVIGDQIVEVDETFTVDLSASLFDGSADATRVTITDARGLGTITNDDVAAISIDDVSIPEGDTGVTSLTFTISSDLQSSKDLGVTVNTNDLLEAIGGTDYTSIVAQPAVISAGTNSTTVTVDILGDEIVELDETFTVDLTAALFDGVSDSTRVGITDAQGIGTIINDDTATLSIDDLSIAEGDAGTTAFTFTISTDLLSSKNLDVTVNTNDLLEAIGGTDYTSIADGTATILAGTNSTQVTVDVIGDQTVEVDETFTLNLSASQFDGATDATRVVIGDASGLGTIINDDTASLTIDDVSIAEGDTGVTSFTFTISSDLTSSKDLSLTVDTNDLLEANGGGTDYTSIVAQSAAISAGDLSTTVTVDVIGDQIVEVDETFTVDLSASLFDGSADATRVTITDASGLGTITNDDVAAISIDDVSIAEGDTGVTSLTFTISSDLQSSKELGVTVNTNDLLEAIGGTDYTSIVAQPAVISAGTNSTTVTVDILGDEIVELDETFTVDLTAALFDGVSDSTRVGITDAQGIGTIINDDTATLSIDDLSIAEGDAGTTAFTFTISTDLQSSKDLDVTVNTNDLLEAIGGTDYTSIADGTATILAGTDSTQVTVDVIGDQTVEVDETFTVDLSASQFDGAADATRIVIGDASGLGTIINDDTASLTIDDVSIAEGDTGVTSFTFTISSDLTSSKDLSVTVDTNDLLEANGGTDYTSIVAQSAVISAGDLSTTVTVDVIGDQIVEVDETFTVDLSASLFDGSADATRVTITDASGLGTITNDDVTAISIDDVSIAEGDTGVTSLTFTISSDLQSSKELGVTVNTNDLLEAIGGTDYTSIVAKPAVISAGTNSTTVTVDILGDEIVELDETFTVDLTAALFDGTSDATRVGITDAQGIGTIINDDTATLSIDDLSIAEGDAGTTAFTFTISTDLLSSKDLDVTVNTNDLLEAVGGTDYTSIADGTATILAGTDSTQVTVDVIGDQTVEVDETFTLNLSASQFEGAADSTRVTIGDASGLGTIINDDTASLTIDDVSIAEGDSGVTSFTFTISSDLKSSKDLSLTVDTNDLLEANGGTDYTSIVAQSAVISAGDLSTTVTVDVIGDQIVEVDETFTVDLSASLFDGSADATRVTITDASGLGTITNDDVAAISIDDVSIAEGDTGVTSLTFTVSSDLQSSKDLGVTVNTNDLLEAIGGTDYTSIVAQPAVISAGTNSTTVTVDILGDEIVELDETFTVDLTAALFDGVSDSTRVGITDAQGIGTIINDDTALLSIDDLSISEGDSGTTAFTFTISSDHVASKDLQVTANTNDFVEAVAGVDYVAIVSTNAVIRAGTTSTSLTVNVLADQVVESDESFTVNLSNAVFGGSTDPQRVDILDDTGLGTVLNDDIATLSIDDVSMNEGDSGTTSFVFTISTDLSASKDIDVTVNTNDLLESVGGTDYKIVSATTSVIAAGDNSTTISVDVLSDEIVEVDETFTVDLSDARFDGNADATRLTIGDGSGLATIVNDDMASLSIDDVSQFEGDAGVTEFTFTISSDLLSSKDLGVTFDTLGLLEAVGGTDYTVISAQDATINAGSTSTTVTVDVVGDEIVEIDETFTVELTAATFDGDADATRAAITDASGLGTIVNDDTATLSIDDVTLAEGDDGATSFIFTVSSDATSSKELSAVVNTTDLLEAVGGEDYVSIENQTVTIDAGDTSTIITVNVMGDRVVEVDETFHVNVSDAKFDGNNDNSRVLIGDGVGQATIANDDVAALSIDDVARVEGDNGTTSFVFTISSDLSASKDLSVTIDAQDLGNAIGGSDLIAISGHDATIVAGETTTTIAVDVLGDSLVELDEVFRVDLSDAQFDGNNDLSRVEIADDFGLGTIINDDTAFLSIDDIASIEGDNGTTSVVFTVSTDTASAIDTALTVQTQDEFQAAVNADYLGVPAQDLVIAAGDTSATVSVDLIGDSIVETDETFSLVLSDALFGDSVDLTRIVIADDTGVATIVNDDSATLSIDDVTVIEGDDGTTNVEFTVRQDAIASLDTAFSINTRDIGEALAGLDYNAVANQIVTIAAGDRSATVTVGVIGETLVEATETFRAELSNAVFGGVADVTRITIADANGLATILNDDAGSFIVDDLIVNEDDGTADLVVSIASPIDVNTTLVFSLDANDDIQNLDNQVTFIAGQSQSQSIRFTIEDDILVEGTETYIGFFELMTRADGRDVTATVATSIDILDNDQATFSFSDVTVNESAGTATLTVATDTAFDIDATFDFSTPVQNDISFVDSSATFAAGSTEAQSVTITINDDQLVELDELIDITLVASTDLGDRAIDVQDAGQVEVIDNDTATFTIEDLTFREGDGIVEFTVSVDNAIDIDTTLGILLTTNDDLLIETPSVTFAGGSSQSQAFELNVVDDDLEELTERFETLVSIETDLGTRDVNAPGTALLTVRDNDTPDFIQSINENILTTTIPILVPTTAPGGTSTVGGDSGGSGSSGASSSSGSSAPAQTQGDSASGDGTPDAAASEEAAGNEPVASIVSRNQTTGASTSQSGSQSLSTSDSGGEYDDTSASQSKNVSTDSGFDSDAGELLFHVVLPNGELGKKFELDIELLNDSSLFDRFRGLPTDVYRVLYREPGSDSFQTLFEIYVVDGKIETILYSPNAPIEQIDPSDDFDMPNGDAESSQNDVPTDPEGTEASIAPDFSRFGRLASPMLAASIALSASTGSICGQRSGDQPENTSQIPAMDRVSRAVRSLMRTFSS